jgi:VCBS repeat-containing protein
VTIEVRHVNRVPVARVDQFTTTVGTPALLDVLANDTDADGGTLSITAVIPGSFTHGTLAIVGNKVLYTPEAGFEGDACFQYTISDGQGGTATTFACVEVQPGEPDAAPACGAASFSTAEDTTLGDDLVCSGGSGPLTYVLVDGPAHGSLTLDPSGSFSYTPDANYHGPDSFTYTASDGTQTSSPATASITVAPVNDAPVGSDAAVTTPEDTPVELMLTGTDVDGGALTVDVLEGPSHGSFAGGVYTPAPNYHGPDAVRFRVSDGQASDEGVVSIMVTPVNDAPVAADASVETAEDAPVALSFGGSDVDGDLLTVDIVEGPTNGTLIGGMYTPAPNYHGPDSVRFRVFDGHASDEGVVSIAVTPVDDPPVADDVSVSTAEDTARELPLGGSDPDGDSLSAEVLEGPSHGTLVGGTYTPDANYHGPDSVRFRVSDGSSSDEGTVSITVTPVNDAPTAADASTSIAEDTPVALTLTGSDPDGDSLSVEVLEGPAHGTLAAGTYTPNANYNGPDSVRFRVSDGQAADEGLVAIAVTPVNDAPVCVAVSGETRQETPVDIAPSCTDVDSDTLGYQIAAQGGKGVASIVGSLLRYLPGAGGTGEDTFRYRALDGQTASNEALATVTITPVQNPNDPPLCADASFSTVAGTPLSTRVVCTDADGDALAYSLVEAVSSGSLDLRPDGTFTYTPLSGFTGTASFRFRSEDGHGAAGEAKATIAVTPAGDVTPPSCGFSTQGTNALGQKLIRTSVRDQGSGLGSITVLRSVNVSIAMPAFAPGRRSSLYIWSTQIDKTKPTIVEFAVADLAGNVTTCDPVFTTLRIARTVRGTAKPHAQTFVGLPQNESKLVVRNARPGLSRLSVVVNGRRYELRLRPGQTRRLDFARAMKAGRVNTVTIRGFGRVGARADIVIADRWV